MEIQRLLGSDIQMVLDECPAFPAGGEPTSKSRWRLSMRWAKRSKAAFGEQPGGAGLFRHRAGRRSLQRTAPTLGRRRLMEIGFDGYAVGGLAVGEGQAAMFETLDATVPHLPPDRPRYLMGVGKPDDIVGAVQRGIDMFDCVLPTRSGRNGQAFTWNGPLNLKNARHAEDAAPLDAACRCPACRDFSRAYLHHAVKAGEIIAAMLLTWHNFAFYQDLMAGLRAAIAGGRAGALLPPDSAPAMPAKRPRIPGFPG